MIDIICGSIHNWFTNPAQVRAGEFTIVNGAIELPFLVDGQYFRIVDSALNDGVYQYPAEGLLDEVFTGEIWPMRPPRAFIELCREIEAWQGRYGGGMASPFSSENIIGVYSYTKAAGSDGGAANGAAWQNVFKSRLNQWRKLS